MSDCCRHAIKRFSMTCCLLLCFGGIASGACAQEVRDADEVKSVVADVLSDPEYRHLSRPEFEMESMGPDDSELPEWLKSFLNWLFRQESSSAPSSSSLDLGGLLFYGSLGVLGVVLIVFIVMAVKNTDLKKGSRPFADDADEEAINPSRPAGELPANEYAERALRAAESGDFRAAIRELVLGAMSWTERVGLIRHRRGLTNRDYIRAVWRDEERRESLMGIVGDFERVFYGHRLADRDMFDVCLVKFQKSFLSEERDAQPTS